MVLESLSNSLSVTADDSLASSNGANSVTATVLTDHKLNIGNKSVKSATANGNVERSKTLKYFLI